MLNGLAPAVAAEREEHMGDAHGGEETLHDHTPASVPVWMPEPEQPAQGEATEGGGLALPVGVYALGRMVGLW
jgi:hypothetical protein